MECTTEKQLRQRLEKELNTDLSSSKAAIRKEVRDGGD
jgi:hypothetical protein